jgi:monofunctional biosynthetic peptidoglycan transglycosylase
MSEDVAENAPPKPSPKSKPGRWRWLRTLAIGGAILTIGLPLAWVGLYRFVEAPGTFLMVERAIEGEKIQRRTVPLKDISPHLVRAVIAAEDARYCSHDGFDFEAIDKAMDFNERAEKRGSKRRRGASTISQQTAKNLFLWADRSWVRKGLETYFTGLIEFAWPKDRIMEAYLNAAEWGDGKFGAEAAAREIFGKSAKTLTASEAARLAAVLPSPNKWRADKPGPYVRRRAAMIERRMGVVRGDGLDACVLKPGAEPPPAPKRPKPEGPPPVVAAPSPAIPEGPLPEAPAVPEPTPPIVAAPVEAAPEPAPAPTPAPTPGPTPGPGPAPPTAPPT